jgi:hypothetical protein
VRKQAALRSLDQKSLGMGYQAWLGFYNSHLRRLRWTPGDLVRQAEAFALECCQLPETPALQVGECACVRMHVQIMLRKDCTQYYRMISSGWFVGCFAYACCPSSAHPSLHASIPSACVDF